MAKVEWGIGHMSELWNRLIPVYSYYAGDRRAIKVLAVVASALGLEHSGLVRDAAAAGIQLEPPAPNPPAADPKWNGEGPAW